jgi:hypothetical protein
MAYCRPTKQELELSLDTQQRYKAAQHAIVWNERQ